MSGLRTRAAHCPTSAGSGPAPASRGPAAAPAGGRRARSLLVAEAPQRLHSLQGPVDLRDVHPAPGEDVAPRRGPERREIAAEDLGARLRRFVHLRLVERDEAALGTPVPQRRLVVVVKMGACPRGAPRPSRSDAGEPVLALEIRERLRCRDGAVLSERPHRGRKTLRRLRLRREDRLAHRRAHEPVVARRDEVERLPHGRRLDDAAARELALERLAAKARCSRPDADVGRRRPLRLHPDEALDHGLRREPLPLQQELTCERRAVQVAQRQDPLTHLRPRRRSSGRRPRCRARGAPGRGRARGR